MIRWRICKLLVAVMLLIVSVACASGLFPLLDEMFGTAMPSVGLAIGRVADELAETDAGEEEIYLNFSEKEYVNFGQYLSGIGASIKEYHSEHNSMTAAISVRNAEMTFEYDWENKKAVATYPSGTRAETMLETVEKGDSILPSVEGVLPSAEFAIGRKPDEQSSGNEGIILTWNVFSDEEYTAFSAYLAESGAVLMNSSIEAGVLNAELGLGGFSFRFVYNWNKQSADVIYPDGTKPESSRRSTPVGSGNVLPEIAGLGRELPRISMALEREPSSMETLEDGVLQEIYINFSEADYNTFSQYLKEAGCSVVDYHTDDSGILVINLTNGSGEMIFFYDALRHTGIAEYPVHNRIERAWMPTPTPDSSATDKPYSYSESACWDIAYDYFMNLRWREPDSVKIYGHLSSVEDNGYAFMIDYSAANGFGGTNRSIYYIMVDNVKLKVINAFEIK